MQIRWIRVSSQQGAYMLRTCFEHEWCLLFRRSFALFRSQFGMLGQDLGQVIGFPEKPRGDHNRSTLLQ